MAEQPRRDGGMAVEPRRDSAIPPYKPVILAMPFLNTL